jgi:hypothetical protein
MGTVQTNVEQQLTELENKYWQALKDKDISEAVRMTDDPCIVTGAQGVGELDHEHFEGMMKSATWKLDSFSLDDVKVRLVSDDVAIVAYRVHEELTVDGNPVTVDAADASTWVRRDGHWVCALHTEALAGDPFGRDRKATES